MYYQPVFNQVVICVYVSFYVLMISYEMVSKARIIFHLWIFMAKTWWYVIIISWRIHSAFNGFGQALIYLIMVHFAQFAFFLWKLKNHLHNCTFNYCFIRMNLVMIPEHFNIFLNFSMFQIIFLKLVTFKKSHKCHLILAIETIVQK